MATIPVQRTWVTDEFVTAAYLNDDVRDAVNFFLNAPTAGVYNSAAVTIPNNTTTVVTFDSERWDNDSMHSTSTNTSRLTAVTAGLYLVEGHATWAGNATGTREMWLVVNGGATFAADALLNPTASDTARSVRGIYKLGAGEYVELAVKQTSGGNLDLTAVTAISPEMRAVWLGVG